MDVVTSQTSVGVRDLKNNLSRYLTRVEAGEDIVVTDRGRPVARLSAVDQPARSLDELIAAGVVRAPRSASRSRPRRRVRASGSVSELVADQRR